MQCGIAEVLGRATCAGHAHVGRDTRLAAHHLQKMQRRIRSLHRRRLRPLWAAPEINQTRGYPLAPPMSICSGEQDEKASGGGSRLPANVG